MRRQLPMALGDALFHCCLCKTGKVSRENSSAEERALRLPCIPGGLGGEMESQSRFPPISL